VDFSSPRLEESIKGIQMKLINISSAGSRTFFKDLIEHGKKFNQWSYCRMLIATRLSMKLTIGGVEQDIVDGRALLDAVTAAAKQGKFTAEEAEVIATQLDKISLRFSSPRTPFFFDIIENELTSDVEVAKIVAVVEKATNEAEDTTPVEPAPAEPAKQRGRKASK
jgi:hypothetical protein